MIPFERALEIVLNAAHRLDAERVSIHDALGRVLAEDVKSDMDMPPFDKSVMDGYACRRADLANELTVIEIIPAGVVPRREIGPNQCAKIMTGSMVPRGADCVVMVEFTDNPSENKIRFTGKETEDHICKQGEDVRRSDVVVRKGTRIEPQHIAVLASVGCVNPRVAIRPRVGVIATGDELVPPGQKPSLSQIRESNSCQLRAQISRIGAIGRNYPIAVDTDVGIHKILSEALAKNDVVVLSGGVSMGDYDLVPKIMKKNGIKVLFEKIAVKPGKPTVFGTHDKGACFGLPGNPVSAFVTCELLVKPFLYKMMGYKYRPRIVHVPLETTINRKDTRRQGWIPVTITDTGAAKAREYHGSAHIGALCGADGLVTVDIGVAEVRKGTTVRVRLI